MIYSNSSFINLQHKLFRVVSERQVTRILEG